MSVNIEIPGWLEACRPDDDICADAYESTPAELRALLKTAIAFAFHRWSAADAECRDERISARSGFRHCETTRPAVWALAVLGEGFASPARFLSALVPAVIAGVSRILVVSEAPFSPSVIAAMELAGLEDSFVVNAEQLPGLYEDMRALSADGRLVFFPSAQGSHSAAQKELMHSAALDGMPRLRDLPAPRILSLHGADSEVDARLQWLHPDAEILRESAPDLCAAFVPDGAPALSVPFAAGPGMEACWPGPSPEFYRTHSCSAFLYQENQEILP